jgi:hypothetical protein
MNPSKTEAIPRRVDHGAADDLSDPAISGITVVNARRGWPTRLPRAGRAPAAMRGWHR